MANNDIQKNTKKHQCSITFTWDDGNETQIIDIYTPEDICDKDLEIALMDMHKQLCDDKDGQDTYGKAGRYPGTLVMELCAKHSWTWHMHEDRENDIELILD